MSHAHNFQSGYEIKTHVFREHHFSFNDTENYKISELLTIHRELHLLEVEERKENEWRLQAFRTR